MMENNSKTPHDSEETEGPAETGLKRSQRRSIDSTTQRGRGSSDLEAEQGQKSSDLGTEQGRKKSDLGTEQGRKSSDLGTEQGPRSLGVTTQRGSVDGHIVIQHDPKADDFVTQHDPVDSDFMFRPDPGASTSTFTPDNADFTHERERELNTTQTMSLKKLFCINFDDPNHLKTCGIDVEKTLGISEPTELKPESESATKRLLDGIRTLPVPLATKKQYKEKLKDAIKSHDVEASNFNFRKRNVKKALYSFLVNTFSIFEPWSASLKFIEGQFGTGVVSYFFFLRWLVMMNFILFLITFCFIILPYELSFNSVSHKYINHSFPIHDNFSGKIFVDTLTPDKKVPISKTKLLHEKLLNLDVNIEEITSLSSLLETYGGEGFIDSTLFYSRTNYTTELRKNISDMCLQQYMRYLDSVKGLSFFSFIFDIIQGTGWMEYSLVFIGYYPPDEFEKENNDYKLAVAFLCVLTASFAISIIMMLMYATKGVEESMLEHNLQESFSYLVICGWDYAIGTSEVAYNRHKCIAQELQCTVVEGRKEFEMKSWSLFQKIRVYTIRTMVHLLNLLCLVGSYYLLFYVADKQLELSERSGRGFTRFIVDLLPFLTLTAISKILPIIFNIVVRFESYQKKDQINITLLRVIFIRQASLIFLLFSFYNEINCEPRDACLQGKGGHCKSPICWETYVGQQMYRIAIMNLIFGVIFVYGVETPCRIMVDTYHNRFTDFIGKPCFNVPMEVISLVNVQTVCWLGSFFCTMLPAITTITFIIFFHIKKYTLLQNCTTQDITYKSSRSNAIFVFVLMFAYFLSLFVVGYSVTQLQPSPSCTPFRWFNGMSESVMVALKNWSTIVHQISLVIFNPFFIIPIVIFLSLILYYYITKAMADMKMVNLLKVQLTLEGKDKKFLLERVAKMKPAEHLKSQ